MDKFIRNFQRDAAGTWRCISAATLDLPTGRIQVTPGSVFARGTTFMGIDLAQMLEGQHAQEQKL